MFINGMNVSLRYVLIEFFVDIFWQISYKSLISVYVIAYFLVSRDQIF